MKKIILMMLCILGCVGCMEKENVEKTEQNVLHTDDVIDASHEDDYVDDNNIIVGLYADKNSKRELIRDYYDSFTQFTDIGSFEVLYTNDSSIDGNSFKNLFHQYYQNYEKSPQYKIGYHIHFSLSNGEVIDKNILRPSDVASFFNYIQVYLYDDIHQNSSYYSHIEDSDYHEDTLITSIKLTASVYIDEVVSPVTLSVFIYDEDDFDQDGKYRGKCIYTINVIKS